MKGGKAACPVMNRTFDRNTVDGVHPIEHKEFQSGLARGFQTVSHRRDIGVKTASNFLNVENESVQILQLLRRGSPTNAIKAVNPQTRFCIDAIVKLLIELTTDAV